VLGVDLVGELLGDRAQAGGVRRQGGRQQVGDTPKVTGCLL
jgi:hypothetical protein